MRFLVNTPTILVFPLFACPFVCFFVFFFFVCVWFFFNVGVMGVTSRCLANRDNLIFLYVVTS